MTATTFRKITILITDDHVMMRTTWKYILSTDPRFEVVGESSSAVEAIEGAKNLRPDIILMDINLSGMNGVTATQILTKEVPYSRIIGASHHYDPSYAREMMAKGAKGYITKGGSREELFTAIMEVYSGKTYLSDEIKDRLSDKESDGKEQ